MKNWAGDIKVQIIAGVLIVGGAIIINLTGFKLPSLSNSSVNSNQPMQTVQTNTSQYAFPGQLPPERIQQKQARMVTNRGEFIMALDAVQSPLAVSNFVYLIEQGYYNGIIWHRVEGWVVQAGDPQTKNPTVDSNDWGKGGPGYTIPDEPVTGEYKTGVVAMAKTDAPNSAGSQFFILLADTPLPKKYQIMGKVTSGMSVVQTLIKGDRIESVTIEPAA